MPDQGKTLSEWSGHGINPPRPHPAGPEIKTHDQGNESHLLVGYFIPSYAIVIRAFPSG